MSIEAKEEAAKETSRLSVNIPADDNTRLDWVVAAAKATGVKGLTKTTLVIRALGSWLNVTADDVSWDEAKKRTIIQEARMTSEKAVSFMEVANRLTLLLDPELPMVLTQEQLDALEESYSLALNAIRKAKTRGKPK